jgi:hypothetical protein
MSKKINFSPKPIISNSEILDSTGDKWVEKRVNSQSLNKKIVRFKRLTLDIPESLHQTIKVSCASRSTKMVDEIREILSQHYIKEKQK